MLDGLPRNSSVLQTPHWTPYSAGTTQVEKYRFSPLSARHQMFAFQHLSSHFGALTCTQASDGPRMCVGHSDTHSIPLRTKKECKPCQRASVEALLRWRILKSLLFRQRDDRG
ncbi:hypothetical protein TNIN_372751 [Trichonephila inaurata madagascariensis]|uniref:Uncharacterized protein n=1 Tax=Trichonephila inaurata madagascariensis TaxID=2747483 RepID=A0A8X7BRD3_9ARAC|nr:hypothetical protein TNIN_372751 [Trichonephila inaurata madagascariensis]